MTTSAENRSGRHRVRVWLLVTVVVLVTGFAVITGQLLYWPATNPPGRADAVLVLSGGGGERHGWRSVALATSTYHIRRTTLLVGRCFKGAIFTVRAPGSQPDGGDFVHEWAGL